MRQESSAHDVTVLLRPRSDKNKEALDEMTPMVYKELPFIAKRLMACARLGHSLQTTALFDETYLRLVDVHQFNRPERPHSDGTCTRMKRLFLVDYARIRGSMQRGTGNLSLEIEEGFAAKVHPDATSWKVTMPSDPWRKSTRGEPSEDCASLMV